jgi:phosphoglycerate kinase
LIAILGGAKVSDKIGVIENLFTIADQILIGGGMANTFFKAHGYQIADSLVENDSLKIAQNLLDKGSDQIKLPVDVVLGDTFAAEAQHRTIPMGDIPDGWRILDIGPDTITKYSDLFDGAGTIIWNGPMGVTEFEVFAKGTYALAKAVADSNAITVIGGGDSVAAVNQSGLANQITHISTGGGAFLELLEGKTLPGLAALDDRGDN